MKSFVLAIVLFLPLAVFAQNTVPHTLDPAMFRPGYDIPAGIPHGTWDFDEWPGVDHRVVYRSEFMYGERGEKVKIDYGLSVFDADDHTGYLRTPETLETRFTDLAKALQGKTTIVGIFAHPDDEILLAGGFLAWAAGQGHNVRVYLLSNGADGSRGFDDDEDASLAGYNCAGIMPDGSVNVTTDRMAQEKMRIARRYAQALGVSIDVLPVRYELDGKNVAQIGEYPGLDFKKSFGPGSVMRLALQRSITDLLNSTAPDVIVTHGSGGEYGNYFHKTVHVLVKNAVIAARGRLNAALLTGFPEYNIDDRITHFIDLERADGAARRKKHEAFKRISFVYREGNDYDKPWNPNDELMDGVFVKDYGYTPSEGKPPRYEFFQVIEAGGLR